MHVLGLDETWSVAYNLGETQTCIKLNIFLLFCREILESVCKRRKTLKSWRGIYPSNIQVYLVFRCVMEKLLIFYICES